MSAVQQRLSQTYLLTKPSRTGLLFSLWIYLEYMCLHDSDINAASKDDSSHPGGIQQNISETVWDDDVTRLFFHNVDTLKFVHDCTN